MHFGTSDRAAAMGSHSTYAMVAGDPDIRVQVVTSASEVICLQERKYNRVEKSPQWGPNIPYGHMAAAS